MKVRELVEQLNECDQNAEVKVEGCDCTGEATGLYTEGTGVLITRRDGWLSENPTKS